MGDTQAKTLDQLIEIMDNEKTTLTKREVSLVSRAWNQSIEDAWPDCKGKYHWMIGYAARLRQQGKG